MAEVGITVHFLCPDYAEGKICGEDGRVKDDFFKFPSTPHLALLGDVEVRGDKVMRNRAE